jgi:radical SAM superfamily enzyme
LKDLIEFERYSNITIIKFVDRTFNYDIKRANEILKGLLDEKYTKIYHIEIRPELFDDEMFDILRKFPKNKLQMEIGIQTTNDKTLNAIDRPSDIKKNNM